MTVKIDRSFRPPVTSVKAAKADNPAPVKTAVSTVSVADELAKFAKLKSEGVLTDAEFAAQKTKLLGQ